MTYYRLDPEIADRVVELTRQGHTARQISERLHISQRTVNRLRMKRGIGRPSLPTMTSEMVARAATMLDDGASYAEVARTLGVDLSSIKRRFPGRGWTRQQCGQWSMFNRYQVREVLGS